MLRPLRLLPGGLLMLGLAACGGGPAAPPSIVLVTLDTLRADHLGLYGYFRDTSPALDRLAAEAVVFDNALTTMTTTLPAHASLMTSTLTLTHGIKGNVQHLDTRLDGSGLATLAEVLADGGYRTAAFVSAAPLKSHTGIQAGFGHWDQPEARQRRAGPTTRRVERWLATAGEGPLFLWVHYFDPHDPYDPPPPYDTAFAADGRLERWLAERRVGKWRNPRLHELIDRYDGEIRYLDAELGKLFAALEAAGHWREAAVVVAGDHGEGLGQHGWIRHGRIFQEQLRVPLLVKLPAGDRRRARRDPRVASLVDVVPTLVAALDLEVPERFARQLEGVDLLAPGPRRHVFAERTHRFRARWEPGPKYALTGSDWKYFHLPQGDDALYDLARDPHELVNVLASRPDVGAAMRDEILELLAGARHLGAAEGEPPPPEVLEELKALGYLD